MAGVIGFVWSSIFLGVSEAFFLETGFEWCLVVQLVCSAMAVVGGVFAVARRLFPLAVTGAVLGMVAGGLTGFAFILGLLGLILIFIGRDAFIPAGPIQGLWR